MKTAMSRPKTNTPAAQDAVTLVVEGATATATAPEAAAPEGEEISPSPNPVPDVLNPATDDPPPGFGITVVIAAKQPIRWRIGRQFTPEPTLIALDDLSEGDVAALRSDPLLLVTAIKDI